MVVYYDRTWWDSQEFRVFFGGGGAQAKYRYTEVPMVVLRNTGDGVAMHISASSSFLTLPPYVYLVASIFSSLHPLPPLLLLDCVGESVLQALP